MISVMLGIFCLYGSLQVGYAEEDKAKESPGNPRESLINPENSPWELRPSMELGFVAPLANRIVLGKEGSDFDYLTEGGEDNLFRYQRYEINFIHKHKHNLMMIFQPLDITSTDVLRKDTQFDSVLFPKDTPMLFRYGFDFYRLTYAKNIIRDEHKTISVGMAMQVRNATIDFRSQNGELQNSSRDIGPVPLLYVAGNFETGTNIWFATEATGSYAPIKYINGASSDVVGALLDASVRGGLHLKHKSDAYVNLRYIGGGAEGTDNTPDPGKDGYVENWLHFVSFSAGVRLR